MTTTICWACCVNVVTLAADDPDYRCDSCRHDPSWKQRDDERRGVVEVIVKGERIRRPGSNPGEGAV